MASCSHNVPRNPYTLVNEFKQPNNILKQNDFQKSVDLFSNKTKKTTAGNKLNEMDNQKLIVLLYNLIFQIFFYFHLQIKF